MKNTTRNSVRLTLALAILPITVACQKSGGTFSLLSEQDEFNQSQGIIVNNKIDILWMVDGSGTMVNHQNNLANNFSNFINGFTNKSYDFHMAVASTDAWVRESNYNAGGCSATPNPTQNPNTTYRSSLDCQNTLATYGQLTQFRDGDIYGTAAGVTGARSGVYLITSLMSPATVASTFATNIRTGVRGDGVREGGLASLRSVLRRNGDGSVGYGGETHTELANFRRSDAFLAVIIVTDEEDQSHTSADVHYASDQAYVDSFVQFMDGYTGSVAGNRNYSVSGIVLEDINNCSYGLHAQATQGDRYVAVAQATNGSVKSICSSDFSTQLAEISEKIVTLASRFQISREPIVDTIVISVNGSPVSQSSSNGWTYVAESGFHYIEFHGAAIPPQSAVISVVYDPVSVK